MASDLLLKTRRSRYGKDSRPLFVMFPLVNSHDCLNPYCRQYGYRLAERVGYFEVYAIMLIVKIVCIWST